MQIWFYQRKAEIGDFVYADGTYSPYYLTTKTVVGVCCYVDLKDASRRLAVGSALPDGPFGLSKNTFPTIELQDHPSYNPHTIMLHDIKERGYASDYLTEANVRDSSTEDGFKVYDENTAPMQYGFMQLMDDFDFYDKQFKRGDYIPLGLYNTLTIIKHRDTVLQDSAVSLPLPRKDEIQTEYDNLVYLISQAVIKSGNNADYKQYYYPPVSYCHSYEPKVKEGEVLADRFKAHNWFLPAIGDLIRICWHYYTSSFAEAKNKNAVSIPNNRYWASTINTAANSYGWRIGMEGSTDRSGILGGALVTYNQANFALPMVAF